MNVLLLSDITPVPLTGGPLVLYRHFMRFVKHEILVVSGSIPEEDPAPRRWSILRLRRRLQWLQRPLSVPLFAEWRAVQVERESAAAVATFRPDVILTVWIGEFLLAAARVARRQGIPLVIICHDDFEN